MGQSPIAQKDCCHEVPSARTVSDETYKSDIDDLCLFGNIAETSAVGQRSGGGARGLDGPLDVVVAVGETRKQDLVGARGQRDAAVEHLPEEAGVQAVVGRRLDVVVVAHDARREE